MPIDNHWHVDGGIFENFPVQPAINKGMQKIIGVLFDSHEGLTTKHKRIPGFADQIRYGLLKRDDKMKIPSLIEAILLSTTARLLGCLCR